MAIIPERGKYIRPTTIKPFLHFQDASPMMMSPLFLKSIRHLRQSLILMFIAASVCVGARPALSQDSPVDVHVTVLPIETLRLSDFDPTNPAAAPVVFTLTIQNDETERDLTAFVTVSGDRSGLVGTATANLGTIVPLQMVVMTNQEFGSYDLDDASTALIDFALERGVFPPDTYRFNARIVDNRTDSVVGEESAETTTTNSGAQIDLIAPGTQLGQQPDELSFTSPVFYWQADGTSFDFELFQVIPGQVSVDDIVTNLPVFSASELDQSTLAYPGYAELLKPGTTYAWRILVRKLGTDGVLRYPSDLLWFRIQGQSAEEPIPGGVQVASIELSPQEQTIGFGEVVKLTADVIDVNGEIVRGDRTRWTVIPESMGTVSADGFFTAGTREGVAAIVAEAGSVEDYATITVERPPLEPLTTDSVYVVIDSPVNAGTLVEPAPTFAWHIVGADSIGPINYDITLTSVDPNGAQQILWQRSLSVAGLPYPTDERALEEGVRYLFDVSAADTAGVERGQAEQVEFTLARNPKLSWDLYTTWDDAIREGRDSSSVTVVSLIRTARLSAGVRRGIELVGGTIELVEGPWVQMKIPFRSLEAIASLQDIRMMTVPAPHVLFNRDSTDSSTVDSNHITGLMDSNSSSAQPIQPGTSPGEFAPVNIAVFEFGFDRLEIGTLLDMNRVQFHTFRQDNRIEGSGPSDAEHGVATVSALVEHLPPSATVHLINFDTEAEFQQALRYAVEELGAQVISCSVSWANAYDHYDGTSAFSTNIAQILGDKSALVVAAGNFAKSHWEHSYSDLNHNGAHNFTADTSYLELALTEGQPYNILLSWADWGEPRMDLDLRILGPNGEPLYDAYGREVASRNLQRDAQFVEPLERIRSFRPIYPGTANYRVEITSNTKDRDEDAIDFELYVYPPPRSASPSPESRSSLASGLATTKSDLVIPVAAVGFSHSSQGPTNDGRIRPDFATNGTITLGKDRFEGTSFATPRVAAILSNILARNPSWSVQKAIEYLRSYALPPHDADKDNVLGWGTINVEAALGSR